MKKVIKNSVVDELATVLGSANSIQDPNARYEIALAINSIYQHLEAINSARKPFSRINEYELKRRRIYEKHCDVAAETVGPNGIMNRSYKIRNADELGEELRKLDDEYKEDLALEAERIRSFQTILDKEVEVEIIGLDYGLIKDVLRPNEIALLLRLDAIRKDTLPGRSETDESKK